MHCEERASYISRNYFLEMLWVKKCRDSGVGNYFSISEYFPYAENLELLFCPTAFVDKK